MFGVWIALPLVCFLTACGASLCYLLSWAFGRRLVMKHLGHRIVPLQDKVSLLGHHIEPLQDKVSLTN